MHIQCMVKVTKIKRQREPLNQLPEKQQIVFHHKKQVIAVIELCEIYGKLIEQQNQ